MELQHKSLLVRAFYLKYLVLLYYCGTGSTICNTPDFALSRCPACVVLSSLPFGWFAIHSRSTEKLTLGQRKGENASPLPKHLPDAPRYLSSHSPAPQSFYYNRSRCSCLAIFSPGTRCRRGPLLTIQYSLNQTYFQPALSNTAAVKQNLPLLQNSADNLVSPRFTSTC